MTEPTFDQHKNGARIEADHMCPACGFPPQAFCVTCWGTGIVSEETLKRYCWEQHYELVIRASPAA